MEMMIAVYDLNEIFKARNPKLDTELKIDDGIVDVIVKTKDGTILVDSAFKPERINKFGNILAEAINNYKRLQLSSAVGSIFNPEKV